MLQEVIHILVVTVQIFVIIISITCLRYINGRTSKYVQRSPETNAEIHILHTRTAGMRQQKQVTVFVRQLTMLPNVRDKHPSCIA